jgi:general secretion pathway protein D
VTATNRFHPASTLVLLLALLLGSAALSAQDYTVNLKDTDIQELIKFVAEATDTTIVVDPAVKGKVKVVSTKPVSASELYQLFLSILDVHGYTAVRSGNVVRVIQNKDARSAPVAVSDGRSTITSEEYVTQVIRLDNISAAKLIPVLRPLVPQQAHMAAYAPSNAIIISDVSANIDKIRDIIERMDKSAVQQTDIIKLQYAVAEDVVKMLDQLNKSEAKAAGGEQETLLVADARTNSVLVSGDELERARMRKLVEHLDTPLEQSGNVKVIYLEYAEAKDIAEVLTRVMKNISELDPAEGAKPSSSKNTSTIEADEGTNALIITADTDEMAALEAVIHRLDIRRAQVLVEAIIVEMEVIDGQDLGLQWLFASNEGYYGSNINANDLRARNIAEAALPPKDSTTGESNVDLGTLAGALASTAGLSLGWGQIDDNLSMTVILNALKETKNANILSTPSLLTLDNQEAYITVGQNVPFVTGSFTNSGGGDGAQNPFQTIERENVGITLTVTPHINDGDAVVLDIAQEVSSLSGLSLAQSASDIITNERKIQTKVLAVDGRVVVLGGLIKDDVQDAQQKVPLLGDIPYLGRLFRSDAEKVTKTNLMIFIRSTIIRDNEQLAGATAEKYRYIRDQQAQHKDKGMTYLDDADLPILKEWEDEIHQLDAIKEAESGANGPGAPAPPVDGR